MKQTKLFLALCLLTVLMAGCLQQLAQPGQAPSFPHPSPEAAVAPTQQEQPSGNDGVVPGEAPSVAAPETGGQALEFSCENNAGVSSRGYVLLMGLGDHGKDGWLFEKSLMEKDPRAKFALIYDQDENLGLQAIGKKFLSDLRAQLEQTPVEELVIFGASAGGVTASYSISALDFSGPVALHTLSSPLKGYGFAEVFVGSGSRFYKEIATGSLPRYASPGANVKAYHHKTVVDTILKDYYCGSFAGLCDVREIQSNNLPGSKEFYYPAYDHNPLMHAVIPRVLKCYNAELDVSSVREFPSLGDMCIGEEACNAFCEDNFGRCKQYCASHPKNPLCQKPFAFEQRAQGEPAPDKPPQSLPSPTVQQTPNCESNPKPVFSKPFADASKILDITPVGSVRGGSPGRSYVAVQRSAAGVREKIPVYAPVGATLTGVAFAYRNYGDKGSRPEYRLDFQVTCEVSLTLDHIAEVVDKIKAVAPSVAANNTRNDRTVSVRVSAGELLGHTDGTLVAGTFDFMLLNRASTASYANPARWQSDQLLYADCPYDYFTPELKSQYYALLQTKDAQGKPECGRVSNDVAGSIAGGWFKANSTFWSGLKLVAATEGDYVDLKISDASTGATSFLVSAFKPPVKPEETKPGGSVCYSDDRSHVFLKLVSGEKLESATGMGSCPASPPTAFESWER